MVAPIRFLTGRQQQQKLGVEGSTENQKVLEVIGNVGIGTTVFDPLKELDVRGSVNISNELNVTGPSTFVGVSTFQNDLYVDGNVNVTGILTAQRIFSSIYGEFSGSSVVSGTIVGTSLSISGISTLGVTNTTDLTTQTLNVSGVSTLGITTFTGAVSFGSSAYFGDNDVLNIGDGNDLQIYHNSSEGSVIRKDFNGDGNLEIRSNTFLLRKDSNSERHLYAISNAQVELYYDGSKKFETTGYGATVFGTLQTQQLNVSGVSTFNGNVSIDNGTGNVLDLNNGTLFGVGNIVINDPGPDEGIQWNGGNGWRIYEAPDSLANSGGNLQFNLGSGRLFTMRTDGSLSVPGIVTSTGLEVSGVTTATTFVGALTGTATTATKLENARTFEITGDVVASPISFDGTGNVSLAATIQPNSVGLGTDTFGDYVKDISGTSNQITVTGGTGEGSTPVISIPDSPVLPGNVTVANDLQVNNNLNVSGNITIGGTTAIIYTQEFIVSDKEIVLGFTTDSFGNEVSNDTTADGGGISIASTEGNPLVDFNISGIHTHPNTYKDIIWIKSGTLGAGTTDAWHFNYGVGIGSTQVPNGVRLAAGSVQFTENDLAVVRNINASGIVTATTFVGALTGTATSTTNIPNLSGDVSSVNTVTTLATVNSNVGTYGDVGAIPSITVNAKGLVTGVTTVAPNNGQLSLAVSGIGLTGSATFTANQSSSSTFTVTSNATDSNTSGTIVARDGSGNFSAGTITANLTGTATTATTLAVTATSTNSAFKIPFANTTASTTGNYGLLQDSGTTFTYNPNSNTLDVGVISVGTLNVSTGIDLSDSDYIYFGTSDDVKVFYDGTANDLEIELESTANKIAITNNGTYTHLITRDGKVGINTSVTPTVELEVNGNANIAGIITASSLVKSGGTSSQFLKADGSVDSSTYLSSYAETDTLNSVTGRGNNTTNGISVGVLTATTGNFSGIITSTGLNVSGVATATTFVGSLTGTATSTTNIPNLSGDVSSVNTVTTLATVNSNVGTYGGTGAIPVVTVNAKGLVTGVSTVAPNNGTLTLAVSGTGLSGSATFTANQSGNSTFTVTSNATSNNTNNAIVSRNSTGGFSAGIITATQFSTGSGTIGITTNTITGPAELIIDPAAVGDNTGLVRIKGDLYVDGTTTQINSTTLEIADKVIGIATTCTSDLLLDGAGIGIGSTGNRKTITWNNTASALTSSEDWNLVSGKQYEINGTSVLNATTLGTTVVNSSLTSVGTLGQLNVSGVTTFTSTVEITPSSNVQGLIIDQSNAVTDNNPHITLRSGGPQVIDFRDNSNGVGLKIAYRTSPNQFAIENSEDTTTHFSIDRDDGRVELNYGGTKKFETTGYGATVFGVLQSQGLQVSGVSTVGFLTATNIWNAGITTSSRLTLNGANDTATGGGQLYLNGATGNRIDFNVNGVAAPTTTTRSAGTKLVLYPNVSSTLVDFALGIENSTLWYSIDLASSTKQHRWYAGTTQLADLKGSGELVIGSTSLTGTASQRLQVSGGAYVSTQLGVGVTNPASNTQVSIAGTLGISEVGGAGTRTLLSSSSAGFVLNHNDNSNIDFKVLNVTKLQYQYSPNFWTIPAGIPLLVGTASSTGTASQPLQVSGGAYVSGNLGVGVTNPQDELHLGASSNVGIRLQDTAPGGGSYATISYNDNGSGTNILDLSADAGNTGTNTEIRFSIDGNDISRYTANANLLIGATTETGTASQRLQVTGGAYVSGNLGIGTTNPTSTLTVQGNVLVSGVSTFIGDGTLANPAIFARRDSGNTAGIKLFGSSGGNYVYSESTASNTKNLILDSSQQENIIFRIAGTTKAVIQPSGELLVGTATSTGTESQLLQVTGGAYVSGNLGIGVTNPTSKLHVVGDTLIVGVVTATSFIKSGGTSTQFLKADGTVDSNTYLTTTGSGTNLTGIVTYITAGSGISVNQSTGNVTITAAAIGGGSLDAIVVKVNGSDVGLAGTNTSIDFYSNNITGTQPISGIASIRLTDTPTFTSYSTPYTLQGSSTSSTSSTSQVGIHSAISSTTYRSVEYMIQATEGSKFHTTKILVIHDGTTSYLTEYGTIYNDSILSTYDVDISGGNIRLLSTPASSGITTYMISFTATNT